MHSFQVLISLNQDPVLSLAWWLYCYHNDLHIANTVISLLTRFKQLYVHRQ